MDDLFRWLFAHTGWLYVKICENNFFFIDYWTFPHIWSGLVVFYLLTALDWRRKFAWLLFFITLYEVIEILLEIFALHIFKPEILKDKLTDVLTGLLGALIAFLILKYAPSRGKQNCITRNIPALFISGTLAFLWAGSYQYRYNMEWMNFPGLNLWAFLLWTAGGFIFLRIWFLVNARIRKKFISVIVSWMIYITILLILEFLGYRMLHIRETSTHLKNPLIFGLVHGSPGLHIYYLIFPFIIIFAYDAMVWVIEQAGINFRKSVPIK